METELFRELAAVARTGSLTAAAKELYVARSALSSHMDALERELGFAVLSRDGHAALTVEGSMLLAKVEPMLADLDETVALLARHAHVPAPGEAVRVCFSGADPAVISRLHSLADRPVELMPYDCCEPFLARFARGDTDLLFFVDITGDASVAHEMDRLGVTCLRTGLHPCSLVVRADNPRLDADGQLHRDALVGLRVLVPAQPEFEAVCRVVADALGNPAALAFDLVPDERAAPPLTLDPGDAAVVSMSASYRASLEVNPLVRLVDTIGGKPFGFYQAAFFPLSPRNEHAARLIQALHDQVVSGEWERLLAHHAG